MKSLNNKKTNKKTVKASELAGYGVITQQCGRALTQMTTQRMKLKFQLDLVCAEYDDFIQEKNLPVSAIGNPFNYNRLNEDEQAYVWGLTLGKVGGGDDSVEGYEFKTAEYNGINKKTGFLNNHQFQFNGKPVFKTKLQTINYLDKYFKAIKGLKIAIRTTSGKFIHFESKMNKATREILLENGRKHFDRLKVGLKDPRMKTFISINDLLKLKNLKLLKGTNEAFARKYLGNTFDLVK